MAKVLVVEKTANIQSWLRKHFSGDHVSVHAVPMIAGAMEEMKATRFEVLIWDAVASKTEQSKGLDLLNLLTKDFSRTYIMVVTDQERAPIPLDRT